MDLYQISLNSLDDGGILIVTAPNPTAACDLAEEWIETFPFKNDLKVLSIMLINVDLSKVKTAGVVASYVYKE